MKTNIKSRVFFLLILIILMVSILLIMLFEVQSLIKKAELLRQRKIENDIVIGKLKSQIEDLNEKLLDLDQTRPDPNWFLDFVPEHYKPVVGTFFSILFAYLIYKNYQKDISDNSKFSTEQFNNEEGLDFNPDSESNLLTWLYKIGKFLYHNLRGARGRN